MRQSGFCAWKVFGGLALGLLAVGCRYLPVSGGRDLEAGPRTFIGTFKEPRHVSADRGFNGTIQHVGSSIDPRTPERTGMRNNSRVEDVTGRPAPSTELGIGGSGGPGEPNSSMDLGWRVRSGYDVESSAQSLPVGPGPVR
ncbi:MAG TPA: hypothetical protein VNA24_31555 [Hyalangium sp.]|jgi:hypothetical protein|nr:hypothetical protein [Hyalangium sp.]